jgi:hypothetical protein
VGVRAAGQKGQQCARAWEGSGVRVRASGSCPRANPR